jgi:hypothetical protein
MEIEERLELYKKALADFSHASESNHAHLGFCYWLHRNYFPDLKGYYGDLINHLPELLEQMPYHKHSMHWFITPYDIKGYEGMHLPVFDKPRVDALEAAIKLCESKIIPA